MRTFLRWWETLGRPERIVAMSLAAGGTVAIANSLTWAVAVCYISRQKAQVAMWQATRNPPATHGAEGAPVLDTEAPLPPGSRSGMSFPLT
jgi:hypothetical protein